MRKGIPVRKRPRTGVDGKRCPVRDTGGQRQRVPAVQQGESLSDEGISGGEGAGRVRFHVGAVARQQATPTVFIWPSATVKKRKRRKKKEKVIEIFRRFLL